MGAGLCGTNGLNSLITRKMILIQYVVTRSLYGLETQVLGRTQVTRLEDFYRTCLRRVQSLPERGAKEAAYLLMVVLPVEAILAHLHGQVTPEDRQ